MPDQTPRSAALGLPDAAGWTLLLAEGLELAKASAALPRTAEGDAWRRSVAPLIECEAVRHALANMGSLEAAERPLARDLAAVTVRRAAGELDRIWRGRQMPEELLAAAEAADRAVAGSVYAGLRLLRLGRDGEPIWMPEWPEAETWLENAIERRITFAAMAAGTLVLPGSPVAWWTGDEGPELPPELAAMCRVETAGRPLQVYRELDEAGRFEGDLVVDLDALPPGMPLLVPRALDGERLGDPPYQSERWRSMQEAALAGREPGSLSLREKIDETRA